MTRIVSYSLYACPNCSQAHLKPNYGSISTYVPASMLLNQDSLITCQCCYLKSQFGMFCYLKTLYPVNEAPYFFFEREIRELVFRFKSVFGKSIVTSEKLISIHDKYPLLQS